MLVLLLAPVFYASIQYNRWMYILCALFAYIVSVISLYFMVSTFESSFYTATLFVLFMLFTGEILYRSKQYRIRLTYQVNEKNLFNEAILSSISEAILITNDMGDFTYVCPNLHYTFGYSDEYVKNKGNISFLFDNVLFDRK